MSTTGSKAGTRITLAANTYTDIDTECAALGDAVIILSDLTDWAVGLVTATETPTALPDLKNGGSRLPTHSPTNARQRRA